MDSEIILGSVWLEAGLGLQYLEKGLRFTEANHPGSIRQGPLVIKASDRLWGSAVHGRKDENRP